LPAVRRQQKANSLSSHPAPNLGHPGAPRPSKKPCKLSRNLAYSITRVFPRSHSFRSGNPSSWCTKWRRVFFFDVGLHFCLRSGRLELQAASLFASFRPGVLTRSAVTKKCLQVFVFRLPHSSRFVSQRRVGIFAFFATSTKSRSAPPLLLFNHSNAPQTFHVLISGNACTWQKDYNLQSMETEGFNIGDLIANKPPDDSGKIIPSVSASGTVDPYGIGKSRLLQSNATTGMARSFSCGQHAAIAGAFWSDSGTDGDTSVVNIPISTQAYAGDATAWNQSFSVTDTARSAGFDHGVISNNITSPGSGTDITASR